MKKVFLVTGSSSGIGKAITKNLLKKKYNVVGISRSKNQIFNKNFTHIKTDLKNINSVNKIFEILKKEILN